MPRESAASRSLSFEQQRADYITALSWVGELMAATDISQFSLSTPCSEFDVRALMGHLVGTAHRGLATAQPGSHYQAPHVVTDVADGDLAATYRALSARIAMAWQSLNERDPVGAPWGRCTALTAARGFTIETVVHGWDLAVATGRPSGAPDGIAERCLPHVTSVIPDRLRGLMYQHPVPTGPNASATELLVSQLGRQV